MTIQHESLHYALIEDTTSTASKLSLKELKPSKVSKKTVKDTIEEAVFTTPVFFGSFECEETLAINGISNLFDDPEAFDVW
jgi:hypothetical protein